VSTPHLPTLVTGLAVAALGTVLLLDDADAVDLDFGALAPIVLVVIGLILLVGGLARRDDDG
jgi:hypothetical protein